MIKEQKQNIILDISQLVCHNLEIDWKKKEVKITRCLEEYIKQYRVVQEKPKQEKKKKEVKKEQGKERKKDIVIEGREREEDH